MPLTDHYRQYIGKWDGETYDRSNQSTTSKAIELGSLPISAWVAADIHQRAHKQPSQVAIEDLRQGTSWAGGWLRSCNRKRRDCSSYKVIYEQRYTGDILETNGTLAIFFNIDISECQLEKKEFERKERDKKIRGGGVYKDPLFFFTMRTKIMT